MNTEKITYQKLNTDDIDLVNHAFSNELLGPYGVQESVFKVMSLMTMGESENYFFWDFFQTSNGSAFMKIACAPETKFKVRNLFTNEITTLTSKMASLTACQIAYHSVLSSLINEYQNNSDYSSQEFKRTVLLQRIRKLEDKYIKLDEFMKQCKSENKINEHSPQGI